MPKFPKPNKFTTNFKKRTPFQKNGIDWISMGKSGIEKEEEFTFVDPSKYFTDYSKKEKEEEQPDNTNDGVKNKVVGKGGKDKTTQDDVGAEDLTTDQNLV
tara:strand:- start:471 stop:773 length:303 start_codon:yes stop_codon:yes gene_type:complete